MSSREQSNRVQSRRGGAAPGPEAPCQADSEVAPTSRVSSRKVSEEGEGVSRRSKSPWLRVCSECSQERTLGFRGLRTDVGGSVGEEKREGG